MISWVLMFCGTGREVNTSQIINEKIHQVLGRGCYHDWEFGASERGRFTWLCVKCKQFYFTEDDQKPPVYDYIRDPVRFWLLLRELIGNINPSELYEIIREDGLQICIAWLKMKRVPIDG